MQKIWRRGLWFQLLLKESFSFVGLAEEEQSTEEDSLEPLMLVLG